MKIPILNDPVLDAEHRDIFACLEQLKDCPVNAENVIFVFQEYILAHTLREEALMVKLDYPTKVSHFQSHQNLLERSRLLACGDHYTIDTCTILLIKHINQEDRAFAQWKQEYDKINGV